MQEWRYRRTTCNVVSTFYTTQYVCWCGVHCQSTYPCFFVHVTFNDSGGVRASVGLYKDTAQQKSVIDVSTENQEMVGFVVRSYAEVVNIQPRERNVNAQSRERNVNIRSHEANYLYCRVFFLGRFPNPVDNTSVTKYE